MRSGPYPEPAKSETVKVSEDELKKFVGIWRNEKTHAPARFAIQNGVPGWRGTRLIPMGGGQFAAGDNQLKFTLDTDGKPMFADTIDSDGEVRRFVPEKGGANAGGSCIIYGWFSEEAGATLTVAVEEGRHSLKQRPATRLPMQPLYTDHFAVQGYVVWFTRDKMGRSMACTSEYNECATCRS